LTSPRESVFVAGASRGIGKALAVHFAARGARVTVVARTASAVESVADSITASGGEATAIAADLVSWPAAEGAVHSALSRFGSISLLIYCAGIPGPFGPSGLVDPELWWLAFQTHVLGAFNVMRAALPSMRQRGSGRVVCLVSRAGLVPVPHLSAYCVSKSAAIRLVETVDAEYRDSGIRAFAVDPGTVITQLARSTMSSADAARWLPQFVTMLKARRPDQSERDLRRLVEYVDAIAQGKLDDQSGRFANASESESPSIHHSDASP
jgi:NAD(P)-dependent dehydrogenase (short-subunit alcohol dehydrogenase family)